MVLFVLSAVAVENEIRSGRKTPHITDELILEIAKGNNEAFHKVYEETSSLVFGYTLSILKDKQNAEDVMQDTFIKIYSASGNYKPSGKPMAWIITICRNLCLMRFREKNHENIDEIHYHNPDNNVFHINTENKMLVERLLDKLSAEEREIVMLHAMSDLKHREIAQLLSIPLSTVLSKYNRAIKKLYSYVKEDK